MFCGCCTALGLTLAENLLPLERFERQIRLILAVLLMIAVLRPLTSLRLNDLHTEIFSENVTAAEMTALAEQAQEDAVSESIRAALNRQLSAEQIPCQVESVLLHIQEDGSICISEVKVSGNLLTGTVRLREWLGEDVQISEGGEQPA